MVRVEVYTPAPFRVACILWPFRGRHKQQILTPGLLRAASMGTVSGGERNQITTRQRAQRSIILFIKATEAPVRDWTQGREPRCVGPDGRLSIKSQRAC